MDEFGKLRGALSHLAFDPAKSRGRRFLEDEEELLYDNAYDLFQLDIEKIRLGKFYRRLYDKTQVFPPEKHANIRNRLIHTNEVVSIASFVASFLGLNKNLAEAIAYGHDIGHAPFGHLGEKTISEISGKNFSHANMSVIVAQKIERGGDGLNLCFETLEGILNHSRGGKEMRTSNNLSAEASLVMISDKLAYTFSDLNDAHKIGYINEKKIPMNLIRAFGSNQRERIASVIKILIRESVCCGEISFSLSDEAKAFADLRNWMFENIYYEVDESFDRQAKKSLLYRIYESLQKNSLFEGLDPIFILSIMTDSEARNFFQEGGLGSLNIRQGFVEIASRLIKHQVEVDIFDPDLKVEDFRISV